MDLSRVIIFTPDVVRLAEFYRNAFDLSAAGGSGSDWTELETRGCGIAFHHIDEHSDVRDGWMKLVFGAADVPAEKQRLESLGI